MGVRPGDEGKGGHEQKRVAEGHKGQRDPSEIPPPGVAGKPSVSPDAPSELRDEADKPHLDEQPQPSASLTGAVQEARRTEVGEMWEEINSYTGVSVFKSMLKLMADMDRRLNIAAARLERHQHLPNGEMAIPSRVFTFASSEAQERMINEGLYRHLVVTLLSDLRGEKPSVDDGEQAFTGQGRSA